MADGKTPSPSPGRAILITLPQPADLNLLIDLIGERHEAAQKFAAHVDQVIKEAEQAKLLVNPDLRKQLAGALSQIRSTDRLLEWLTKAMKLSRQFPNGKLGGPPKRRKGGSN